MRREAAPTPRVEVQLDAPNERIVVYAQRRITAIFKYSPAPVLRAQVRIQRHHDPAVAKPVHATGVLSLPRLSVRAEVSAAAEYEAIDLLRDRLASRLSHRAQRATGVWTVRHAHSRPVEPAPHERSRAAGVPTLHGERARTMAMVSERSVVRSAPLDVPPLDLDDAADELLAMDYEFLLFTEAGSGQASVLSRTERGFGLLQVEPARDRLAPHTIKVQVSSVPAPTLSIEQAAGRLDHTDAQYVFFVSAGRQRPGVLYRRFDGNYGLITLARRLVLPERVQ